MLINREENFIHYGKSATKLVLNSYFGDAKVEFYRNAANLHNSFDSFITIKIPIYYPTYEDENFGINIVYQYNSNDHYIIEEDF